MESVLYIMEDIYIYIYIETEDLIPLLSELLASRESTEQMHLQVLQCENNREKNSKQPSELIFLQSI